MNAPKDMPDDVISAIKFGVGNSLREIMMRVAMNSTRITLDAVIRAHPELQGEQLTVDYDMERLLDGVDMTTVDEFMGAVLNERVYGFADTKKRNVQERIG